jgi:hypothetical protein
VSCRFLVPIDHKADFSEIATGKGKVRVPWKELQRDRNSYIKPKYLPKEVTLQQYYHLRQEDVQSILKHWTRRQAAGKAPFRFREAVKDSQQDISSQAQEDVEPQGDGSTGEAADAPHAHMQHRTGEGVTPGPPDSHAPNTHAQQDSLSHPFTDGPQEGQPSDGVPAENRGGYGPAALEPPSSGEVSNIFDAAIGP